MHALEVEINQNILNVLHVVINSHKIKHLNNQNPSVVSMIDQHACFNRHYNLAYIGKITGII